MKKHTIGIKVLVILLLTIPLVHLSSPANIVLLSTKYYIRIALLTFLELNIITSNIVSF